MMLLVFIGNLGAVPSCCFAMLCRSLTLGTSGGNRDIWTLVGARVGRVLGDVGEIAVVCTLRDSEPRGVVESLGGSTSSQWGSKGGALGM
jgi:hypothetical protein